MLEDVEFLIKKNPYMAISPNLIEYFAIIGYKENFIPKILNTYKTKKNQYKPIVLSGIISTLSALIHPSESGMKESLSFCRRK